ncbi:MAG: hypothetical protein IPG77_18415 [Betaproteobacteria bacterium]|nr:hypothetical protein [Betaproteobacteria bacterium]
MKAVVQVDATLAVALHGITHSGGFLHLQRRCLQQEVLDVADRRRIGAMAALHHPTPFPGTTTRLRNPRSARVSRSSSRRVAAAL